MKFQKKSLSAFLKPNIIYKTDIFITRKVAESFITFYHSTPMFYAKELFVKQHLLRTVHRFLSLHFKADFFSHIDYYKV